jgi:hypothetical protein
MISSRVCEVHTASVRAPALCPESSPDGASSTTRPAVSKACAQPACHSHHTTPLELSLAFSTANTWTYNSSGLHRRAPRRRGMDLAPACRALRRRRLYSLLQALVCRCVRVLWGYRRSSLDFSLCFVRGIAGNTCKWGKGDKNTCQRSRWSTRGQMANCPHRSVRVEIGQLGARSDHLGWWPPQSARSRP